MPTIWYTISTSEQLTALEMFQYKWLEPEREGCDLEARVAALEADLIGKEQSGPITKRIETVRKLPCRA